MCFQPHFANPHGAMEMGQTLRYVSRRAAVEDPGRSGGAMDQLRTLAIDIGGTGIKAAVLDDDGNLIGEHQRVPTPPKPIAPENLVRAIDEAVAPLGPFDRVSVGF